MWNASAKNHHNSPVWHSSSWPRPHSVENSHGIKGFLRRAVVGQHGLATYSSEGALGSSGSPLIREESGGDAGVQRRGEDQDGGSSISLDETDFMHFFAGNRFPLMHTLCFEQPNFRKVLSKCAKQIRAEVQDWRADAAAQSTVFQEFQRSCDQDGNIDFNGFYQAVLRIAAKLNSGDDCLFLFSYVSARSLSCRRALCLTPVFEFACKTRK